MSTELLLVLAVLTTCMVLFVVGRPRSDIVGLLVIAVLPALGLLSVSESLAGFADPNVVMIAALFVVGEALVRTGIVYSVGDRLAAFAGSNESMLLIALMMAVALLGAFMSSTGIVAIFVPVVLQITTQLKIHPGRLMMPLSFAGLISGMLTLVATPPNMIVDGVLKREGFTGFSFLSFTPVGLAVLAAGIIYMLIARRMPSHATDDSGQATVRPTVETLIRDYGVEHRISRFRVPFGSPLIGRELKELDLRRRYEIDILAVDRRSRFYNDSINPVAHTRLQANDILFVYARGSETKTADFAGEMNLIAISMRAGNLNRRNRELGLAELLVPPDSGLIGKSVAESAFRHRYHLQVIGLRRSGKPIEEPPADKKLKMGDVLLVIGTWKAIRALQSQTREMLTLTLPAEYEQAAPATRRAPYAAACVALMIGLMISGVVPNVVAVLSICLLLGLFRCIDMESAYKAIHWPSLVLIAGMIPLATALEKSGGVELAANFLIDHLGAAGPRAMLASLFLLTAVIGLFVSNTATAALLAPVAIGLAKHLNAAPQPFVMTVAIAASAAFMTPISSPVNMLVMGPGRYRFGDYVKVGVPFTVCVLVITVVLVPWLFPLYSR